MTIPNWSPLGRHSPVYELSREDGGSALAAERRRFEDGLKDTNTLSAVEAVNVVRAIRAKALRKQLPDSTATIRADRDGR